jgi:hypothetical protein
MIYFPRENFPDLVGAEFFFFLLSCLGGSALARLVLVTWKKLSSLPWVVCPLAFASFLAPFLILSSAKPAVCELLAMIA